MKPTNLLRASTRKKYLILREVVLLLQLLEFIGLGGGLYFLGKEAAQESAVLFVLLVVSSYSSSKLGWLCQELQIRMATGHGDD